MISKIINILFQLGLITILVVLLLGSIKVVYLNLKYFNIVKTGKIIELNYSEGSRVHGEQVTYLNTIITDIEKDSVYGGSQLLFSMNDNVKFRYRGEGGNIIFEVNGKKIGPKYDVWDWLSPFLLIFTSFLIYKIIKHWLLQPIKDYFNA